MMETTYRRFRQSQTARSADLLRPEMEKLQHAVKRVSDNWNDVVAQGVQTNHINMIVSSCNSVNSLIMSLSNEIESNLMNLEELQKQCLK